MITILYNTKTQKIEHHIEGEYLVDGKTGIVDLPLLRLIEQKTERPSIIQTQKLIESWEIQGNNYVQVWTIVNKTEAEIIAEKEAEANEADQNLSVDEVKKLLRMRADSLSEAELYQFPSVYPAWRPGEALKNAADSATGKADIRQYKGKLYKVVLSHTTQIDWLPDISSSLFTVFNPPETISVFVHPTGAHDVYKLGAKVYFPTINDSIYESLIDNNSYSPTEYPQGWKKL